MTVINIGGKFWSMVFVQQHSSLTKVNTLSVKESPDVLPGRLLLVYRHPVLAVKADTVRAQDRDLGHLPLVVTRDIHKGPPGSVGDLGCKGRYGGGETSDL